MKKYTAVAIGVIVGAGLGIAYYHWVGCASGTCPITSRPIPSALYGALLGGVTASWFKKN